MESIESPAALGPLARIAVIIDCGTPWVSTLALVSVLRAGDYPVLVVDCAPGDASTLHFRRVAAAWELRFFHLRMPLRPHGATLDRLLAELRAPLVLLVDSDLELLDMRLPSELETAVLGTPTAYGGGLLHGPAELGHEHGFSRGVARYSERMWIPLVLLRRDVVVEVVESGISFRQRRQHDELPWSSWLSRLFALRWRLPLRRLFGLAADPRHRPVRPCVTDFDTGALVHAELKRRGHVFVELPGMADRVIHLHGATRRRLGSMWRRLLSALGLHVEANAIVLDDPERHARERLAEVYGCRLQTAETDGLVRSSPPRDSSRLP